MKKIIFAIFSLCALSLTAANISWSFPPEMISASGQTVDNPSIAVDPNGNIVSVWVAGGAIKARTKLFNMSWSTEVTLSGANSSLPSVVIDPNGNATAVWLESGAVRVASKTLNGSWSSSSTLSSSNARNPTMAIDGDGDIIVAWARNGDVQTTTKLFGGSWQNVVTINGTSSARPFIAVGGSGSSARTSVVWEDVVSSVNVIYGASKLLTTSPWGKKQIISNTALPAGYPRVAVDAKGNTTAVWFAYNVAGSDFYGVTVNSAFRPAGGSWASSFCPISKEGIANPANLSLSVGYDSSGNAIAVWNTSFDNEKFTIQSAIKYAFRDWSEPQDLVTDNLYAYKTSTSVTSSGDALALYMFYDGADLLIQSSEIDITGFNDPTWSLPVNLSQNVRNSLPYIAVNTKENTMYTAAVWVGVDGMNNVALASLGTKSLVAPPSNLSVSQSTNNFSVFIEYYNTVSWDESTDPNVVGYLVYRNGVFIEQVDSSVLSIIDDNRVENDSVVYGVAAIDNQGSRSQIMTVTFP